LTIRHYGKANSTYNLYDDDGETFDYEKGAYTWRTIKVERDRRGVLVGSISAPERGKPNTVGKVTFEFMTK
jgi:alpha-D-xyloside xylohydrolase